MAKSIVIIGKLEHWKSTVAMLPVATGLVFVDYSNVKQSIWSDPSMDLVLSALFSSDFDALDVAQQLTDAGFKGKYRAVAKSLPNPAAVKAEVSRIAPHLDFDIFILDQLSPDKS